MKPHKQQLVNHIAASIDSICPYSDSQRQRLYHIGFLQAQLAEAMLDDNRHYYRFLERIRELERTRVKTL